MKQDIRITLIMPALEDWIKRIASSKIARCIEREREILFNKIWKQLSYYPIITCYSKKHISEYSFKRCYWVETGVHVTTWDSQCFSCFDVQQITIKWGTCFLSHFHSEIIERFPGEGGVGEWFWGVRGGLGWDVFSWYKDCGATISITSLTYKGRGKSPQWHIMREFPGLKKIKNTLCTLMKLSKNKKYS